MRDAKERLKRAHKLPDYIRALEKLSKEAETPQKAERYAEQAEKARREYREIKRFIDGIEDEWTRTAFVLRYIEGRSWRRVGAVMNQTADAVRVMCSRYIEKNMQD